MPCCFKPQKEKYEFSGSLSQHKTQNSKPTNETRAEDQSDMKNITEKIPERETSKNGKQTADDKNQSAPVVTEVNIESNTVNKRDDSIAIIDDKPINPILDKEKNIANENKNSELNSDIEENINLNNSTDQIDIKVKNIPDVSKEDDNNNSVAAEVIVTPKRKNKHLNIENGTNENVRRSVTPIVSDNPTVRTTLDESNLDEKKNKMEEDVQDHPSPDYSDSDDDDIDDCVQLRKDVENRISAILTRAEWDSIVDKVGKPNDETADVEIPAPDYDHDLSVNRPLGRSHTFNVGEKTENSKAKSSIPTTESTARHNINRELMMNQKLGIDVLHRKSELKKELDRRKDREKAKMKDHHRKNSFEMKLEQMAAKAKRREQAEDVQSEKKETDKIEENDAQQPEFLRIHSKIYKNINTEKT